ncbi:MAG: hypothetical protein R2708_11095 [Vicinamibacterales bacterium]
MLAEPARGAAGDALGDRRQQLLGEVHERPVVHVGPVELEHVNSGLCWVEMPSFLKLRLISRHALDAADHQPLQVEFRRDPESAA